MLPGGKFEATRNKMKREKSKAKPAERKRTNPGRQDKARQDNLLTIWLVFTTTYVHTVTTRKSTQTGPAFRSINICVSADPSRYYI